MKRLLIIVATLLFAWMPNMNCSADLVIDITGVEGSGVTLWTFSGDFDAGAPEAFNAVIPLIPSPDDSIFAEQGNMFKGGWSHTRVAPTVGALLVTTPNGTRSIDELYLHEVGVTDEIGVAVDGATDLEFVIGDNVSWVGAVTLNIDMNEMNQGTYNNDYFAFIFGTLELTVNIGDAAAVPEPAGFLILGVTGFGILARRRRKASISSTLEHLQS